MKKLIMLLTLLLTITQMAAIVTAAPPPVPAGAYVLIDAVKGLPLASSNPNERAYPASLTKIATAMLAIKEVDLNEPITASANAVNSLTADSSRLGILPDEELTMEQLLYALLLGSANDAANVIAERVGTTFEGFCLKMNEYAKSLGCTNTNFTNAHGLHSPDHYTTPQDMAIIAADALKNPQFAKIVAKDTYIIEPTNKFSTQRKINNTNHLMLKLDINYYPHATGIKTGYTDAAKSCLAASAERDGMKLVAIIMSSPVGNGKNGTFETAKNLFEYAFEACKPRQIIKAREIIDEMPIANAKNAKTIMLEAAMDVSLVLPEDFDIETGLTRSYSIDAQIKAPVAAGDPLNVLELKVGDVTLEHVPLVADKDYEYDMFAEVVRWLFAFITSVPFVIAVIILILALLVIRERRIRRLRRERRRQRMNRDIRR